MKVRISVTTRSGETYSKTLASLPRFWKSRAMGCAPVGTDFRGCSFKRERVA